MYEIDEKEFPVNKIAYAPSREINQHQGDKLDCIHQTKTLLNESNVIMPTENIFTNMGFSG